MIFWENTNYQTNTRRLRKSKKSDYSLKEYQSRQPHRQILQKYQEEGKLSEGREEKE